MKIDQTHSGRITSLRATSRGRWINDIGIFLTGSGFLLPVSLMLLVGSGMQGYANGTAGALFMAFLFFIAGIGLVKLVFQRGQAEMRAFLLTYSVCVFAGGLAQCYSLALFNNLQSTIDAFTFFDMISPTPPFITMANMPLVNAPLAVLIWQQVYKLTWFLGFKFGPYTGVMLNALVVGLTGTLTVRTAREIFGDDHWRLRRVGTLFAFCGLFILFGAILIRDCFTTFLNALVLLGIVRWLVRPTGRNVLIATALTGMSAYAMVYLRLQAVLLFGLYGFLGFLFWLLTKGLIIARLLTIYLVICVLLLAAPHLLTYIEMIEKAQTIGMAGYVEQSANSHSDASLGMRFVIDQPLLIRVVLGSGMLMVFPIPLWAYFNTNSFDYHWFKGYHGIYQILLLPLVFVGFIATFRMFWRNRRMAIPLMFLAAYILITLAAVVATSLEQRHLAQFMPSFMILAALPDTRENRTQKELKTIVVVWSALVVLVHLAWMFIKGGI